MITQLIIAAVALGTWFVYFPWHKGIHDLLLRLQDVDYPRETFDADITVGELRKRIKELPEVVQKYFKKVCHDEKHSSDDDTIPYARSLRMEQEGEFLLNGKFVPFTASQEFRCRLEHAGFVWHAAMETNSCLPSIHVCDAYIDGAGTMRATTAGVPVINVKPNTPELNQGELMRWAAEAILFPLALLPLMDAKKGTDDEQDTTLKWLRSEDGDVNAAVLELKDHNTTARITFYFDSETHLVKSIKAMRPRGVGAKSVMTPWEGFVYDYETHCSLLVPTRMEAGWQVDDKPLEIYFKGRNKHLIYLTNHHPHLKKNVSHQHDD